MRNKWACGFLGLVIALIGSQSARAEKELLWGDTHLHTALSTDSFLNQNFTIDPDAAYRFARGLPIVHPTTGTRGTPRPTRHTSS